MSDLFSTPNLRDERVVIDDPDALDTRPLAGVGGKHDLKMIRMKAVTSENPFHSHFSDSALKRLKALMANEALDWADQQAIADALLLNAVKAAEGLDRHWHSIYELAVLVRDSELFRTGAEGSGFASSPADNFEAWWKVNMQAPFAKFKEFEQTYHLAAEFGIHVGDAHHEEAEKRLDALLREGKSRAALELQARLQAQYGNSHGGDRHSEAFKRHNRTLERPHGDSTLRVLTELERKAASGDAAASELLERADRKEISYFAAAKELGLRRPKLSVELEPQLDARLREVAAAEGVPLREVVELALTRLFRWLESVEPEPEPEPEPSPAIDPPSATEPEPGPEPAQQDQPPTPAGEQSAERPQLGDLISGAQVGPLLGKSLAHASNAIKRAQEKGKPIATIQQDGWVLVRDLAAEDKRWRVIEVPA